MKIEDARVNEFRMLIKPLSLGMQLGGIFLVVMAWLLADDSYKYDTRQIFFLLALTMISIGASWKIPFFSLFSITTVWLICLEFVLLAAPSVNRNYWMTALSIGISLAVAPVFSRISEYIIVSAGIWLIFGRGSLIDAPLGGDTKWSWLLMSAVILVGIFLNALFARIHRQSILLRDKLVDLAFTDALTGIDNRRKFLSDVDRVQGLRDMSSACLLMIDIDNFKRINDDFGHPMGDEVLQQVAQTICRSVTDEPCGRLGGEEFGIFLTQGGEERAIKVADQLLLEIRKLNVIGRKITASVGISKMNEKQSFSELMKNADEALYIAKSLGKDRFAIF
ncbi:GGDEF domain-containing protein [Variovorax paradoxus]|uniref:GGDEF domain-containing protein n=1 Tax=Variovorax paradoxus TaxID=34073 RepID=UPI0021ACCDD3|nr:GGDEF domain-containing protein [Variovorax paradoxus]UVH54855.1 GGDEF domain-containing protein [Variovorax paradoxus]